MHFVVRTNSDRFLVRCLQSCRWGRHEEPLRIYDELPIAFMWKFEIPFSFVAGVRSCANLLGESITTEPVHPNMCYVVEAIRLELLLHA